MPIFGSSSKLLEPKTAWNSELRFNPANFGGIAPSLQTEAIPTGRRLA